MDAVSARIRGDAARPDRRSPERTAPAVLRATAGPGWPDPRAD